MRIAFRHTTAPLVTDEDRTFSDAAVNQMKFETVKCPKPRLTKLSDTGSLLNGKSFTHTLYKKRKNEVVISSNELTDAAITFLETIWTAMYVYVSYNNGATWSNYVEITLGDGDFPISYIDELEYLPEVTLSFTNTGVE